MANPGLVAVLLAIMGVLGGAVGHIKNRTAIGVMCGLLGGVIGVVVIACIPAKKAVEPEVTSEQ